MSAPPSASDRTAGIGLRVDRDGYVHLAECPAAHACDRDHPAADVYHEPQSCTCASNMPGDDVRPVFLDGKGGRWPMVLGRPLPEEAVLSNGQRRRLPIDDLAELAMLVPAMAEEIEALRFQVKGDRVTIAAWLLRQIRNNEREDYAEIMKRCAAGILDGAFEPNAEQPHRTAEEKAK